MITGSIGIKDRFAGSGAPWELIREFEVSAERITHKAVELVDIKKNHQPHLEEYRLQADSHR